jgi:PST family polysaccharide transporter
MSEMGLNLKDKIFKGGAYLVTREALTILLGFANVLILTRLIGPKHYGLYAAAFGMIVFLWSICRMGIDVYLIRSEKEPTLQAYHQAFTLMFCSGMMAMLIGVSAIPLLQRWYQDPAFIPPFLAMLVTLPLSALAGPALARFEREINYKTIVTIELIGQFVFCIVSFLLAYLGKGVWAPVVGYISNQVCLLICALAFAKMRPRFFWSWPLLREMMAYGIGYSASFWVWQFRYLVNSLIVGRYAGPEAVGYVSLTINLTEQLSFVKRTAWRLSIPVLAKLQSDFERLKKTMEEAVSLQLFLLGPFLAGFALLAPWLLPLLFGERWQPVLLVYPFISLGTLVNTVFSMHSSALYVLRRNWSVTWFHLFHIFLLSAGAFLFVRGLNVLGYGLAEVIALLSYILIHFQVAKLFRLSYAQAIPWVLAFGPPLFATLVPNEWIIFLWLPFAAVLFFRGPRGEVAKYIRYLMNEKTNR